MIYLDNAATTYPKPESVYQIMDEMNRKGVVNAGRGAYRKAQEAARIIDATKQQLRELVHVGSHTPVVFSPSITVAINQIIHGLSINENSVVFVSPYEHNAVARSLNKIAKDKNITIIEIPIEPDSLEIDIEKYKYELIKHKPQMVLCTHISNVTGYILPIEKIFSEAKKVGCITVLDSAQSLGLLDINANTINADIIAFAGHKSLYGPIGIGGFINVNNIPLDVFIAGGTGSDSLNLEMPSGTESRYEPASINITAVAGLNKALELLDQKQIFNHEIELMEYLLSSIKEIDGVRLLLPGNNANHIGILSILIDGIDSDGVGIILDEDYDIAVRTGYHCAPYIHKYLQDESYLGTVRISLGQFTTKEDIDCLVNALKSIKE